MIDRNDKIRTCIFRPYLKGKGPTFKLTLFGAVPSYRNGQERIAYELTQRENGATRVLFAGEEFGPSPMQAHDSDECVEALMGFLTLRPGDTDADYFAEYTPEQLEFCSMHAEALACEVGWRFGFE